MFCRNKESDSNATISMETLLMQLRKPEEDNKKSTETKLSTRTDK